MSRLLETHARISEPRREAASRQHHAGDVVNLEIHAVTEEGATVRWPSREELQSALGSHAAVLDGPEPARAENALGLGEAQARAWRVQLLLPPGEGSLGPVPLAIVGQDGAELERGEVPAVPVTMATVLEDAVAQEMAAAQDPAQMKAQATALLAAPRGPWQLRSQWPLGWIALAAVVVALFALLARWIARRPKKVAPPPPPEPAEVVARRRLAELGASGLAASGQHLVFHVELADILRRYLTIRLGTDVVDLTTDEVRRMLRGELNATAALALGATPHAGEARVEIVKVLTACDLVKFARHAPAPVESLELLRDVGRIVDMTTREAA